MTAPWGSSPWGLGAWSVEEPLGIYAITTSDVVVGLSSAPLARSPVLRGDATNPSTWQLVRLDTGAIIPIASVSHTGTMEVVLHTQVVLPPQTVQLELTAPTLLDSAGAPLAFGNPALAGVTEEARSTPEIVAATQTQAPRDLLNRQVPAADGSLSGTLVVRGGDYATELGVSLLRKLVIRRLTAKPGDFYHLPNYGVGLRAKSPLPAGDLVRLQAAIKQQIQLEPEVASVKVTVTQSTNTLLVALSIVSTKTGQQLDVGVPFKLGGGP